MNHIELCQKRKEIGSKLRHIRITQCLSQTKCANEAALTRKTISKIENGGNVEFDCILLYTNVLNIYINLDIINNQ